MYLSETVLIDAEAARSLAQWKALFADEVCKHAKRLAAESGQPRSVTLSHYRQGAKIALESLSAAIELGDDRDVAQKAG